MVEEAPPASHRKIPVRTNYAGIAYVIRRRSPIGANIKRIRNQSRRIASGSLIQRIAIVESLRPGVHAAERQRAAQVMVHVHLECVVVAGPDREPGPGTRYRWIALDRSWDEECAGGHSLSGQRRWKRCGILRRTWRSRTDYWERLIGVDSDQFVIAM